MNCYTFAQLQPGQTESFTVTVTEEMMAHFHALTGDSSPIHMDDQAARARGHSGRVVYGMLGASMFSTLAGVYLPGERCLLHSVEAKFAKPIYIGDTLTVTGAVKELNSTFQEVEVKATVTNQRGEKVIRGGYKAGVE